MKYSLATVACLLCFASKLILAQDFEERLGAAANPRTTSSDPNTLILLDSPVKLINDINVPALETGQLIMINVREGQLVEENAVLAQINDSRAQRALEESQLNYQLAYDRANDNSAINVATATLAFRNEEYQVTSRLHRNGNKSESEFRSAKASKEIAEFELIKVQNEKKLAAIEAQVELVKMNATKDIIDRHLLKSPVSGNVVQIDREKGEWVNAGETVFRIARMDKLRVVAFVDAVEYNPSALFGRAVTVSARPAGQPQGGEEIQYSGKIVYIALEQKGLKGTFEVWAEVDNQVDANGFWMLNPGTSATLKIHLDKLAPTETPAGQ